MEKKISFCSIESLSPDTSKPVAHRMFELDNITVHKCVCNGDLSTFERMYTFRIRIPLVLESACLPCFNWVAHRAEVGATPAIDKNRNR